MRDLYQEVTTKILSQLEAGIVPWVRPWKEGNHGNIALPHNAKTRRAYSGINIPLLWMGGGAYAANGWLTYKQAQEMGGTVRKGERGTTVVYADRFIPKSEKDKGDDARFVWFLKAYTVFNVEQCDGIDAAPSAPAPTLPQMHDAADALITATGARIVVGGDHAFYAPHQDYIAIPPMPAYHDQINWYRTAFHELGHWTGHKDRLARDFSSRHGDYAYAAEELVAEMCAAFTCASLGIQPTVRHADYIGNWIGAMQEDNKIIFKAASAASKAADYLLRHEPVDVKIAA